MMSTATTPRSPRPDCFQTSEETKSPAARPGFLLDFLAGPCSSHKRERTRNLVVIGSRFRVRADARPGMTCLVQKLVRGYDCPSIHHDLDAVAHLDLGGAAEPVEQAEAFHRVVDAGHAMRQRF